MRSDEPTGGIPNQFVRTKSNKHLRSWLQLIAPTATAAPARLHYVWRAHGRSVVVQFDWGMDGWTGMREQSGVNEFAGNLRPIL
jgi:hypothetical protein